LRAVFLGTEICIEAGSEVLFGTNVASPEQKAKEAVSFKSDVYQLGMVFAKLMNKQLTFVTKPEEVSAHLG